MSIERIHDHVVLIKKLAESAVMFGQAVNSRAIQRVRGIRAVGNRVRVTTTATRHTTRLAMQPKKVGVMQRRT